jgi:hypothetical protein
VRILFYTNELQWGMPETDGSLPLTGVGQYRVGLPAEALARWGGHETYVVPELLIERDTGRIGGRTFQGETVEPTEIVVLQRPVTPELADEVRTARAPGQVVIGETDDYLFGRLNMAVNPAIQAACKKVLLACDAITVSTPYIAERLRSWAPSIHVVRNAIDPSQWGEPEDVSDGPVLGWTGIVFERPGDIEMLSGWLGPFMERHDLRFIHSGDQGEHSFAELAKVDPERVITRPAIAFRDYAASRPLNEVDIQLIPIASSNFNEGKSALKGLESAACGVPFVASPHDEYRRVGFGRVAGSSLASQKSRHWQGALEALLD